MPARGRAGHGRGGHGHAGRGHAGPRQTTKTPSRKIKEIRYTQCLLCDEPINSENWKTLDLGSGIESAIARFDNFLGYPSGLSAETRLCRKDKEIWKCSLPDPDAQAFLKNKFPRLDTKTTTAISTPDPVDVSRQLQSRM